jgi:2-amino-4-hydroxy-6-hydroxymethyldihydropteridine diphosphokinase
VAEHLAWLLLGSNIDPETHLAAAVERLSRQVTLLAVSSAWQSPPADGSRQPDYLNAAALLRTECTPEVLLKRVTAPIEKALGRVRTADAFVPRTIDIDLALYDDRIGTAAGKALPHPDILRYAHCAIPLAEISPETVHPATGETLRAIAGRLRTPSIHRREDINLKSFIKPTESAPEESERGT